MSHGCRRYLSIAAIPLSTSQHVCEKASANAGDSAPVRVQMTETNSPKQGVRYSSVSRTKRVAVLQDKAERVDLFVEERGGTRKVAERRFGRNVGDRIGSPTLAKTTAPGDYLRPEPSVGQTEARSLWIVGAWYLGIQVDLVWLFTKLVARAMDGRGYANTSFVLVFHRRVRQSLFPDVLRMTLKAITSSSTNISAHPFNPRIIFHLHPSVLLPPHIYSSTSNIPQVCLSKTGHSTKSGKLIRRYVVSHRS